MRILFIMTFGSIDAASRHRAYSYISVLKDNNIKPALDILFPDYLYKIKNKKGLIYLLIKCLIIPFALFFRLVRLPRILFYDVVIVYREAFPFFTPVIEKNVRLLSKKMIFDFDDAVYLKTKKWKNWRDYLRNPSLVKEICRISDFVIVGNKNLASYVLQYNDKVEIIPTVYKIDKICQSKSNEILIIGWIGSWNTLLNLELIMEPLKILSKKCRFKLRLIGASNIKQILIPNVDIEYFEWNIKKEFDLLNNIDIGIMPLLNDEWEQGKCGFKLIQYLTLGKPVVASPVGENKYIVKHGINGFLAKDNNDWVNYLKVLLDNEKIRIQMGLNGSNFIQSSQYSFKATSNKLVGIINNNL